MSLSLTLETIPSHRAALEEQQRSSQLNTPQSKLTPKEKIDALQRRIRGLEANIDATDLDVKFFRAVIEKLERHVRNLNGPNGESSPPTETEVKLRTLVKKLGQLAQLIGIQIPSKPTGQNVHKYTLKHYASKLEFCYTAILKQRSRILKQIGKINELPLLMELANKGQSADWQATIQELKSIIEAKTTPFQTGGVKNLEEKMKTPSVKREAEELKAKYALLNAKFLFILNKLTTFFTSNGNCATHDSNMTNLRNELEDCMKKKGELDGLRKKLAENVLHATDYLNKKLEKLPKTPPTAEQLHAITTLTRRDELKELTTVEQSLTLGKARFESRQQITELWLETNQFAVNGDFLLETVQERLKVLPTIQRLEREFEGPFTEADRLCCADMSDPQPATLEAARIRSQELHKQHQVLAEALEETSALFLNAVAAGNAKHLTAEQIGKQEHLALLVTPIDHTGEQIPLRDLVSTVKAQAEIERSLKTQPSSKAPTYEEYEATVAEQFIAVNNDRSKHLDQLVERWNALCIKWLMLQLKLDAIDAGILVADGYSKNRALSTLVNAAREKRKKTTEPGKAVEVKTNAENYYRQWKDVQSEEFRRGLDVIITKLQARTKAANTSTVDELSKWVGALLPAGADTNLLYMCESTRARIASDLTIQYGPLSAQYTGLIQKLITVRDLLAQTETGQQELDFYAKYYNNTTGGYPPKAYMSTKGYLSSWLPTSSEKSGGSAT